MIVFTLQLQMFVFNKPVITTKQVILCVSLSIYMISSWYPWGLVPGH